MKFLIPGQIFSIFASPTKGMDTFLFKMSMKWMLTFKNFRNLYWHGKQQSAMSDGDHYTFRNDFHHYYFCIVVEYYLGNSSDIAHDKSR